MKVSKNLRQDLKEGDVFSANCPSRSILNHLSSKWGVLVLSALYRDKVLRFSELRNKIEGISERMLGQTLKLLEVDGFILRKSYNQVPPVVEYSLTPSGKEASKRLLSLVNWIEKNLKDLNT